MKRILSLSCLMTIVVNLCAQGIHFSKLSFDEAKALATQEGKSIFVDVYTTWCGPCRRMAKEVFVDESVADYFNANYICLKLDAENEREHGFFKAYVPSAYPSLYWLTSQGELLDSHSGYMDASVLLEAAKRAESSTLSVRLKALEERWNGGERSEALLHEYLFDLLPKVDPTRVRPLLNDYLCGLPSDSLASKTIGEMIQGYSRTLVDDKVCRTLLEYSDNYRELLGKADFDRTMYMLLVRIPMADKRMNENQYEQDCNLIREMTFPHKEMYLKLLDVEELLLNKEFQTGLQTVLSAMQCYEQDFPNLYSELCYTLIITGFFKSDYAPTEAECALCLNLAEKAFDSAPSQSTLTYLAAAYARIGDFQKAYELVMYLPFYGKPTLSNAVYGLLNLQRLK